MGDRLGMSCTQKGPGPAVPDASGPGPLPFIPPRTTHSDGVGGRDAGYFARTGARDSVSFPPWTFRSAKVHPEGRSCSAKSSVSAASAPA